MTPMRLHALLALVSVLALGAQGGLASAPDSWRPSAAIAYVQPDGALIAWAPGAMTPDYYTVYGIQGDTLSPILTVPSDRLEARVSAIYPGYAVAAVFDGVESEATIAATLIPNCIYIYPTIPPYYAIGNCSTDSPPVRPLIKVKGTALP